MKTQNGWKYAEDEWTGLATRDDVERAVAIVDPAAWEISILWTDGAVLLEGVAEGRQLAIRIPRRADLAAAREVLFSYLGRIRGTWLGKPEVDSNGPIDGTEWDSDALAEVEASLYAALDLLPEHVATAGTEVAQ